jgi:hypothetical protein
VSPGAPWQLGPRVALLGSGGNFKRWGSSETSLGHWGCALGRDENISPTIARLFSQEGC